MDWDKLRIFHVVAEAGSFTRAGEILDLSQSALSRQISALEESLGVQLFHRHARGLLLTEQGEMLEATARDIFAKLSMVEGHLTDARKLPEGPLRITVAGFLGSTWLAPKLAQFHEQYPDIQLSVLHDDRIYDLSMREADAAIRLYETEQSDMLHHHLTTIQFHICGTKSYFERHGRPEKVKDLKDHTLLGYPEGTPTPFNDANWLFRMAGIDAQASNRIMMMNSLYSIYNAVKGGAGLAALPDYLIAENNDLEIVLPKTRRPGVEMYFVYPAERQKATRINVFRDFLLTIAGKKSA